MERADCLFVMPDKNRWQRRSKFDNEMQSRYDKTHGDKGLCHTLVEIFHERCSIMLNVNPFARIERAKLVEILDDEMQSRYEKIR